MLKCTGYYSEPEEEIDYEYYEKLGIPVPAVKTPEIMETACYIKTEGIQAIFDTQDGKMIIYYDNGWDLMIKKEEEVLKRLIDL